MAQAGFCPKAICKLGLKLWQNALDEEFLST